MSQFLKTDVNIPIEFISCGQFLSREPWTHTRRNLKSFVIIIGVKGTLYITQEGTQYEIKPGDILLLLSSHTHLGHRECKPGVSFYWCHFNCSNHFTLIDDKTMEDEVISFRSNPAYDRSNPHIFIPIYSKPQRVERINILFNQLLDVSNANYYNKRSVDYIITTLLIEISEQALTNFQTTKEKTKVDKNLVKIVEWLRIHTTDNISVTSVAEQFNYNKDYLSRIFKQKIGINIQEYIHILKVSKAKDLLSSTNLGIKEIAYTVGISDEKYFMKLFKKYEKLTPTEFRKAYYRTHLNKE
ncbi:AraC family transcriptional regulator [Bacillus sp. SA1-12]|uniref:AraC family transcriptional regulator n=1 Tax=Bacillus sp. SA1-12 TaxID=1455638 RepID=UPI0006260E38|nr:AraC family transcriptional regulator [Bacillus sp. SA1-12]KKI92123.1 AraC family transcriptional regulator [Bacillus sp. SA1-12]